MKAPLSAEQLADLLRLPAISVVDAGKVLGLGRNGAYEAALRGDFKSIRMGKRIVVPTAPLREQLGLTANVAIA